MRQDFDWEKAMRAGAELARDDARYGKGQEAQMWALLRDAFRVARFYAAPPRMGYPVKSSFPEAPDEISVWHKVAAYVRGEVGELPEFDPAPIPPSAEEMTRSDHVLRAFHSVVSQWQGSRGAHRRQALSMWASGARKAQVIHRFGLSSHQMDKYRKALLVEMVAIVRIGK